MENKIQEHYHCSIIDEEDNLKELSVCLNNGVWEVWDDWGEITKGRTLLSEHNTKKEAVVEAYSLLKTNFNFKSVVHGAGCPNDIINLGGLKRKVAKNKNEN